MNAFGFALTAGSLLALTLYAGAYARKSSGTVTLTGLDLKKAGVIVTAFGLYFDVAYLLWLLFGTPSGFSVWSISFVGHNLDLWMISLPLSGLPLPFPNQIHD